MTALTILVVATTGIAVALAFLAIGVTVLNRQVSDERMQRRIGGDDAAPNEVPAEILARDANGWVDRRFYQLVSDAALPFTPGTALLLVAGSGLVLGGIVLVLTEEPGWALLAMLGSFALPMLAFMIRRSFRIAAMEKLLPGALEQLADCLHGGQTLEQSAELVSVQTPSPLKEEFGHCVSLLRMGQSPVAVMDRMARRIPLPEFRLFATAVLVHRQTGGNLARLTARLAISARDRQEWRRHIGSQTIAGRYSAIGVVVCGVVGFTILSIWQPQYTAFFLKDPKGWQFLVAACALVVVGTFWVSRIVRINY